MNNVLCISRADLVFAFNCWMEDYTKNPEAYEDTCVSALRHMNELLKGEDPTYGDEVTAIILAYINDKV